MVEQVHISKECDGIDAGRRVPNHNSKCRNPHGHRYRVVAHAVGQIVDEPGASDEGMLVDFGVLKAWLNEIHDKLDHGFIVYHQDEEMLRGLGCQGHHLLDEVCGSEWKVIVFPYIPTAENIARWVYEELQTKCEEYFRPGQFKIQSIEVWETPTSMARYPA